MSACEDKHKDYAGKCPYCHTPLPRPNLKTFAADAQPSEISATANNAALKTSSLRDRRILEAIERFTGKPFEGVRSLKDRCHLFVTPDGREVFTLDGVALIEFYPMQMETVSALDGTKMKVSQKYRSLV